VAAWTGNPSQTNLYFVNAAGTSFSAPLVAGGAALLVDAGKALYPANSNAVDARVVKAVLMNSADRFAGWDNGQRLVGPVLVTTQSLDYASGAGRLNLARASTLYMAGVADLPGAGGAPVGAFGWDYGRVAPRGTNDYLIAAPIPAGERISITLDWFVTAGLDTNAPASTYGSFRDLDLELWTADAGQPAARVAQSSSLYNNTEMLDVVSPSNGFYLVRVVDQGALYDFDGGGGGGTPYGLAWSVASAVPEPSAAVFALTGGLAAAGLLRRRRRARFA
jgi:hypothetical protein